MDQDIDKADVNTIKSLISTMTKIGKDERGKGPHDFMVSMENQLLGTLPPFMDIPFADKVFDPFRFLAEMYASLAYAEGRPFEAMQPLAFGSGDTDTVTTFLGTLMGAWYGESALRADARLSNDFEVVEKMLNKTFKIDLDQCTALFDALISKSAYQVLV